MPTAVLTVLLCASAASADTLSVRLLSFRGVPDAQTRRVQGAVEEALRLSTAWTVTPAPAPAVQKLAPCPASDRACLLLRARSVAADRVLLLDVAGSVRLVSVVGHLVDVRRGLIRSRTIEDVRPDDPDAALEAFVQGLLPPEARRGFGALWVEGEPGATLKLDGRKQALPGPSWELAVPSGVHEVDVQEKTGQAVLHRVDVPEGSRTKVGPSPANPAFDLTRTSSGPSTLRMTAYGLWSTAGVAFAAALVAGALSNYAIADRGEPCVGDDRTCPPLESAAAKQRRAQLYTRNANIFAGVGAGLAAGGGLVFVLDLLTAKD